MDRIYALRDPISLQIRYVGKTCAGLHQRLLGHISDAKKRKRRVRRFVWIRDLQSKGHVPLVELLEECSGPWQEAECRWIAKLKAEGCDLLNGSEGGEGRNGFSHSLAARAEIAAKARARYEDPAYRKKMGDAVRAGYLRPEARANLSASIKCAFAKPEVKARQSAAQKIAKNKPEAKAASSRAHLGKKVSEETKKKMSAARVGKKLSPEVVERIAAGHRGLKRTDEQKVRMRAAITSAHKAASSARLKERYAKLTNDQKTAIARASSERMIKIWADRRAVLNESNR